MANLSNILTPSGFTPVYTGLEEVGTITGTTLDLSTGSVFSHEPASNAFYEFSGVPALGTAFGFTLKVTPSATISITWPSAGTNFAYVIWPDGVPAPAPASGETSVYVFYTAGESGVGGGRPFYGFLAGENMS